ncbi:hypothetical protein ADM96_20500 [Burkholderia sp. ST111]|nr:hypothetical protein ADM96_20500 [Burkholderia sp. ST111]
MNTSLWVKFLAAVLLFAAWGALVLMKLTGPEAFVFAIGQALVGLGVYHASTNNSAKATLVSGEELKAIATPLVAAGLASEPQEPAATAFAAAPTPAAPQAAAGTLQ